MNNKKLVLAAVIGALLVAFFAFDLARYFTLDAFHARRAAIDAFVHAHPIEAGFAFFALYIAVTGLSLPGAALMTLIGGAIFGLAWGTLIVSFASSIGATLAFLAARYLLRDAVQSRFGAKLAAVNAGIAREGALYLVALRLVPAFPFVAVNLVMALTPMRTRTFYWVSQAAMLPGTVVYVNAGTQIAGLDTLGGILSPGLIASFALLGLFPLIARRALAAAKARKALARWPKPPSFERNVVVIGGGSAGLVAAYIAAAVKARVTLIEKHRMGGDCLNTGCVPSKALIRTTRLLAAMNRASDFGLRAASAEFDFPAIMARVKRVVNAVAPHDSVERYEKLGVECIAGEAKIVSPYAVAVQTPEGTRTLTTRAIVIAAGAEPIVPPIPGIEAVGYVTSDTLWELRELPRRLVVLGGGPIGSELAQCFARLGSQVTQIEMFERILMREDPEISEMLVRQFRAEGIAVLTGHKATRFAVEGSAKAVYCEADGRQVRVAFDQLLCAVGRRARLSGYGLEELGMPRTPAGTIEVNAFMQTVYPNIYACGDVAGPYQFTHTAAHTAWYASVNALFGGIRKFRSDFSVIPWTTFTDPEVAHVGLNETQAKEQAIPYEISTFGIDELDRAIADEEARGVVKVLTVPGKDRILGATIAGAHAGEIIIEFTSAMRHRVGLNGILRTIHVYPTFSEANKYAAGNWRRAHAPRAMLRWLEKYHAWMRG